MVSADASGSMGHDVLENPQETLRSMIDAGRDGADPPDSAERVAAKSLRRVVEDLGLIVLELSAAWAWGFCGPGGNKNPGDPDWEARRMGVECSNRLIDPAVDLGEAGSQLQEGTYMDTLRHNLVKAKVLK